jgi:hypothetical protein
MKKSLFCVYCIFGILATSLAQVQQIDAIYSMLPEEDASLILKFEPNLNSAANRKRTLFKMERQYIDTMQVSDKKKQRLLRNVYKDIYAGTFEKIVITDTVFVIEIDE